MPAPVPINFWHWAGFTAVILVCLAIDLGVFHRSARVVTLREALVWSAVWIGLAMIFAQFLFVWRGPQETLEFFTGYVVEFSLSMDNVFAIVLIFSYFGVEPAQQHRVLYWGILGALLMRGIMIGVGAALLQSFDWIIFVVGAFLLITGLRWAFSRQEMVRPEKNLVLRLARRIFPVSPVFDGQKFTTRMGGLRALTPLALVLLMVETTDLLFAVDSIPAIFAVTQKAFIVFTSNIFAILGLRSLYFVLAGAMRYFRYLRPSLAVMLILIGGKMLAARWHPISTGVSLAVVAVVIGGFMAASIIAERREKGARKQDS